MVCTSFALAVVADGQGPAYPGTPGPEPDVAKGRKAADTVHRCMNELRAVAPHAGAYVSESNFFEPDFQHSYWGSNHARLAEIKKKIRPRRPLLCPQRSRLGTVEPRRVHQALNAGSIHV